MNQKTCPNCGALMPEDSKFCTECGSPFPVEKKEEKPAPRPAVQDNPPAEAKPSAPKLPDELFTEEPVRPVQTAQNAPAQTTEVQTAAQAAAPAAATAAAVGYAAAQAAPAAQAYPAGNQPYQQPVSQPIPHQNAAATGMPMGTYPQAAVQQPSQQWQQPAAQSRIPSAGITESALKGTPEEPISTWGWLGIFLLLGIPVVNLILLIAWACGGCRKNEKKYFARGMWLYVLVAIIIIVILGLVLYFVGRPFVNSILNQFGYELV